MTLHPEKEITSMKQTHQNGFPGNYWKWFAPSGMSMLEMLFVLALLSILAGMAASSFNSQETKLRTAAYALRTELLSARALAIKEYLSVKVTFDEDSEKYTATMDGQTIMEKQIRQGIDLQTGNTSVSFTPLGTATSSSFDLVSESGKKYTISVNGVGRVKIE